MVGDRLDVEWGEGMMGWRYKIEEEEGLGCQVREGEDWVNIIYK